MQQRGFTLVETLVVTVVIGLVLSLTLVAVQSARESSRRIHCSSNFHQVALAVLNYESTHNVLPPGSISRQGWLVQILPQLELPSLREEVVASMEQDTRIRFTKPVSTYTCPSDPQSSSNIGASSSIAGNGGVWAKSTGFNGAFAPVGSFLLSMGYRGADFVSVRDVTDGLSQTAAMAEIIHADKSFDRMRVTWNLQNQYGWLDGEGLRGECSGLPSQPRAVGYGGNNMNRGTPWVSGDFGTTLYNHLSSPNSASCFNGTEVLAATIASSSLHNGVVGCAFLDGHVAMVSDNIDSMVWRQYGSRDGVDQ